MRMALNGHENSPVARPISEDTNIAVGPGARYTLQVSDFPFTARSGGHPFAGITLTTTPQRLRSASTGFRRGELRINGHTAFAPADVSRTTIERGGLVYIAHETSGPGIGFDELRYKVKDTERASDSDYRMRIDVLERPEVIGAQFAPSYGDNGLWDEGEHINVEVTFDQQVTVATAGGTPSVEITLGDETRTRRAGWVSGQDTNTLTFRYTMPAGESSHHTAALVENSLALNGGSIALRGEHRVIVKTAHGAVIERPGGTDCGETENELWCSVLVLTTDSALRTGHREGGRYLANRNFRRDDTQYQVYSFFHDQNNGNVHFETRPNGIDTFNRSAFTLYFGAHSASLPATRLIAPQNPQSMVFDNIAENWPTAGRVFTRLVGPASGNQEAVDPPAVDGVPTITGWGSDGSWTQGQSVQVTMTFTEAVDVDTSGGTPTVGLDLAVDPHNARSASYESGSGTEELVFAYTFVEGDGTHSTIALRPNSLALSGGTIRSTATRLNALLEHHGTAVQGQRRRVAAPTARFENVPEQHDGQSEFAVTVGFSATPNGLTAARDAQRVLEVSGGTVASAKQTSKKDGRKWTVTIKPESAGAIDVTVPRRACDEDGAVCVDAEPIERAVHTTIAGNAMTASFAGAPQSHEGTGEFTVEFTFSHEPAGYSYRSVRDHLFDTSGGIIKKARRMTPGSNRRWELTVRPDGEDDTTLSARATRSCTAPDAACDATGRKFDGRATLTVAGPASTPDAMTATWWGEPEEHDGTSSFEVGLILEPPPGDGFSYRAFAGALLSVEGATLTRTSRQAKGENQYWLVKLTPTGSSDVTVTVNATTDCAAEHAACTAEGGMLEGGASVTVRGPAQLTIADAEVEEAPGARLEFEVRLSRALDEAVTVAYESADGSATAGDDYTAVQGTLTFEAGENLKIIPVEVADDAHDEGSETLTLTLSDAAPAARVQIGDASATGTITNDDPMPQAWITRFGRTIGTQAVDALTERLSSSPEDHLTIAGARMAWSTEEETTGAGALVTSWESTLGSATGSEAGRKPANWRTLEESEIEQDTLTREEILLGTRFHVTSLDAEGAGTGVSAWGRVARGGFEGEEDDVTLDGTVTSAFVGADAQFESGLAGLMLSHSRGTGSYELNDEEAKETGEVESTMTTLYPYANLNLDARTSAWALAGVGSGTLELRRETEALETDLSMRIGAGGIARDLLAPTRPNALVVRLRADAMWVRTESEKIAGLEAARGDATRLRLALEGEGDITFANGAMLTPSGEIGLRLDGGDAETGAGMEVGAGMRYSAGRLSIEGRLRSLVAHEAQGYEEWGASASLKLVPDASGRGLSISLTPTWGAPQSKSAHLWSAQEASELEGDTRFEPKTRLEAEMGYGIAARKTHGLITPYLGLTHGESEEQVLKAGTRWEIAPQATTRVEISRARGSAQGERENTIRIGAELRW